MTSSIDDEDRAGSGAPRGAQTRERLLQGAFESLYENGYAATTTVEVCARTGISRGSLLHCFPTRAELVAASVEYVLDRRLSDFRSTFEALPSGKRRNVQALELLRELVEGPAFYAWMELMLASRTDAELNVQVREVMRRFRKQIRGLFAELFPDSTHPITLPDGSTVAGHVGLSMIVGLLSWLAIDQIGGHDEALHRDIRRTLKVFAGILAREQAHG